MRNEVDIKVKEVDVWKAARAVGGVSVRYSNSYDIYEIILPEHKQCCVLISDNPLVDEMDKRIMHSISKLCFRCSNIEGLRRVLVKLASGQYDNQINK